MADEYLDLNIDEIVLHPFAASSFFFSFFRSFLSFRGILTFAPRGINSVNSFSKIIQQSTQLLPSVDLRSWIHTEQQTVMTYSMRCCKWKRELTTTTTKTNKQTFVKAIYNMSRCFISPLMIQQKIYKEAINQMCFSKYLIQ